ncbi:MAG: class I SAM-dependent methyltransferase, partial [Nitrospirae bacterium]|nr:class I SAM-dependent methyltransferase [Nitrospirota bacterium]
MSNLGAMKEYWDTHPIGVECFEETVGSPEFFKKYVEYYDAFLGYKWRVFNYSKYRGHKVLEIGCGLGLDSVKFAQSGADLTCIDLSDTSVRLTRELLEQLKLKGQVLQGDCENLEFPDESFDVVYAYGVLMLPKNERKAMSEVFRVLKRGGEALVVLYHRRSWFWLLSKFSGTKVESEKGDPPLNRVHSLKEVRKMFQDFSRVE